MHMTEDEIAMCAACERPVSSKDEMLGGQPFGTIVPMHRTSLRSKAGYVHNYKNVAAEKTSVQVPKTSKD
jgi:hypothetical protein